MWLNSSLPEEYDFDLPTIPSQSIRDVLEGCLYIPVYTQKRGAIKGDIPIMSVEFHNYCMSHASIPDFDVFIQDYMSNNSDWIRLHAVNFIEPLIARVERAYPSLVRDIYFVSLGREAGFDLKRTLRMDLDGIDAVLDGVVPIRLFFDSKRSRADKRRKSIVHGVPENCVDFGIKPASSESVGGVYLYKKEDIIQFLSDLRVGISHPANEQ